MKENLNLIDEIDNLLPQTQCRLCSYSGCRPYAEALIKKGERIDRCLPGGTKTLKAIADLLQQDPNPYIPEMENKAKPTQLAVIRENECIGCTKCIQACPIDAIIGASKQMHTVIADICTGCELCVEPCPVDCIDIVNIPDRSNEQQKHIAEKSRQRYHQHQQRSHDKFPEAAPSKNNTLESRQAAIRAAVERVKAKREMHEPKKT